MNMKKNDKLHIPVSTEFKAILKARADKCGLPLSQYCLFVLSNAQPKIEEVPD